MFDSSILEVLLLILLLIQTNDSCNIYVFENINIFVWMVSISLTMISVLDWSHKCDKLAWNDPVKVSILNSLVVFVLFNVEGPKVIPSESYSIFEALKTMEKCAVVEAISFRGISVMFKHMVVWLELLPGLLS